MLIEAFLGSWEPWVFLGLRFLNFEFLGRVSLVSLGLLAVIWIALFMRSWYLLRFSDGRC